jgi:Endoplasmic Reticulum Oxidoreductin 1 (ERO1)
MVHKPACAHMQHAHATTTCPAVHAAHAQAIKIILASESCDDVRDLSRNEVIALVNTAAQLAKSVGTVPKWKRLELQQLAARAALYCAVPLAVVLALAAWLARRQKRQATAGAAAAAAYTNGSASAADKKKHR